ncbi:MAG: DJ-1 family glyoxalase III [Bacillota bacterium]
MIYAFWVNGFEAIEAITPVDLLRRAGIQITTVSLEESKYVKSSVGVTYKSDAMFSDCNFADLEGVFLAGGPGTKHYLEHESLLSLISEANENKKLISAICAAPMVLSILDIDAKMTVYPSMKEEVTNYVDAPVVVSGNVITGEAVSASIQFALELIKYIKGDKKAKEIADSICVR